jgi:hypothetical protein
METFKWISVIESLRELFVRLALGHFESLPRKRGIGK